MLTPKQCAEYLSDYSSSWRCKNVPPRALSKQEGFICAILRNPQLAVHVQSLSWTLLLLKEPEWDRNFPYPLLRIGIREDESVEDYSDIGSRPIMRIWEVFAMLTNVKTLDLAYLTHDHGHPLAAAFPDALFPRATSIRLSGVMEYALAASILAANPAKLQHLIWDNLQQSECIEHFLYRRTRRRRRYHRRIMSAWNHAGAPYISIKPYFASAGPMQNLLGSLAGRCTNLTSLTLRKVGEVRAFSMSGTIVPGSTPQSASAP